MEVVEKCTIVVIIRLMEKLSMLNKVETGLQELEMENINNKRNKRI